MTALGALTLPWITDPLRMGRKPWTRPENAPLAFCPAGDETQSPIGRVPRLGPGWLTFGEEALFPPRRPWAAAPGPARSRLPAALL